MLNIYILFGLVVAWAWLTGSLLILWITRSPQDVLDARTIALQSRSRKLLVPAIAILGVLLFASIFIVPGLPGFAPRIAIETDGVVDSIITEKSASGRRACTIWFFASGSFLFGLVLVNLANTSFYFGAAFVRQKQWFDGLGLLFVAAIILFVCSIVAVLYNRDSIFTYLFPPITIFILLLALFILGCSMIYLLVVYRQKLPLTNNSVPMAVAIEDSE